MIYDISQEVFGSLVFPGDPKPAFTRNLDISKGDVCNLTSFFMSAHNGTHVAAPFHFYGEGKTIDQIALDRFVGPCYVAEAHDLITKEVMENIITKAKAAMGPVPLRLLVKGDNTLTEAAAKLLAGENLYLYGNESQTVGPADSPKDIHLLLLGREVVLLEGIRLIGVPEGTYTLCAAPLNLGGADGAPCRAILISDS